MTAAETTSQSATDEPTTDKASTVWTDIGKSFTHTVQSLYIASLNQILSADIQQKTSFVWIIHTSSSALNIVQVRVEPLHQFLRWMAQTTCFRPRTVLVEYGRWVTSCGRIHSQNSPKKGVNRQFQAKTPKFIMYITISPEISIQELKIWGPSAYHKIHYVCGPPLSQSNLDMANSRRLENQYDVVFLSWVVRFWWNLADWSKMTWRVRLWSKWKPEVKLQYGRCFFFF